MSHGLQESNAVDVLMFRPTLSVRAYGLSSATGLQYWADYNLRRILEHDVGLLTMTTMLH